MKRAIAFLAALLTVTFVAAADIDELVKKLRDKDADIRRNAAKELSDAGADAKAALPALVKGLGDKDLYVRRFSAQAIGNIGPDAQPAIYPMVAVLKNPKEQKEVQEAVVAAMGNIGKGAVEALIAAVRETSLEADVRRKAIDSLGKIGPDAHSAVTPLVAVLQGKDSSGAPAKKGPVNNAADLRIELVTALGNIANGKDEAAVKALDMIAGEKSRNRALKTAATEASKKVKARKS